MYEIIHRRILADVRPSAEDSTVDASVGLYFDVTPNVTPPAWATREPLPANEVNLKALRSIHVGGVGIPYGITQNAEDPDLAAEFINYLVSERALELMVEQSALPGQTVPAEMITADTLAGDLYTAWNAANEADAIGHYMDWATPTFYDTLTSELQRLLGDQTTPEAFAQALQADYARFLAEQT